MAKGSNRFGIIKMATARLKKAGIALEVHKLDERVRLEDPAKPYKWGMWYPTFDTIEEAVAAALAGERPLYQEELWEVQIVEMTERLHKPFAPEEKEKIREGIELCREGLGVIAEMSWTRAKIARNIEGLTRQIRNAEKPKRRDEVRSRHDAAEARLRLRMWRLVERATRGVRDKHPDEKPILQYLLREDLTMEYLDGEHRLFTQLAEANELKEKDSWQAYDARRYAAQLRAIEGAMLYLEAEHDRV